MCTDVQDAVRARGVIAVPKKAYSSQWLSGLLPVSCTPWFRQLQLLEVPGKPGTWISCGWCRRQLQQDLIFGDVPVGLTLAGHLEQASELFGPDRPLLLCLPKWGWCCMWLCDVSLWWIVSIVQSWFLSGTRTDSWEPESSRFHLEALSNFESNRLLESAEFLVFANSPVFDSVGVFLWGFSDA